MPGSSSSTTQQQSQTQPWAPAQPLLTGILGQLSNNLPNTGLTGAQGTALNQIENNNSQFSNFTPAISGVTSNLLAGGGALNQAPAIQNAYNQYQAQTTPLASNTNYDPMQTPGLAQQLQTIQSDVSNNVNGQFAAAGRDGSAYNQQALARGIAQGEAPVITAQYNQNVQNQQGAANNLYNAGNTNAGLLSGLQQQYNTNQTAGVNSVGAGVSASNAAPTSTLAAEAQRLGIPLQNLGLISNIGIPIAGLGAQSTGQSQTQSSAPWYSQVAGGAGALSGLLGLL
jgi:hypothetical protein